MTFVQTVQFPKIDLDVSHNPPLALRLNGAAVAKSFNPEPRVIDIHANGEFNDCLIIQEGKEFAIPVNDFDLTHTGKVFIYNYETGELKFTFQCDNCIMNLKVNHDILFVQVYNAWKIRAWNWKTGKEVELPKQWNKIDQMSIGENFTAHNNFNDSILPLEKQKPIDLYISDPETLKPKQIIKTNLFGIYDMAIKNNSLYVLGIDGNSSYSWDSVIHSGCIMKYENPLDEEPISRKISISYDVNLLAYRTLKMDKGSLYNSKWYPSTNYVFDAESLTPLMSRKTEKSDKYSCALTKVLNDTAVVFDDIGMEIYRKAQTNFESVKKIEWGHNDPGTSIEIFKFLDETVITEGYKSGLVRIRDPETFKVKIEFTPPQNMSCVVQTKFHNNKLLVHYSNPSLEGTLAILYDLLTQKPLLYITVDALKNSKDTTSNSNVHFVNNDIFVRCKNQVLIYSGVLS